MTQRNRPKGGLSARERRALWATIDTTFNTGKRRRLEIPAFENTNATAEAMDPEKQRAMICIESQAAHVDRETCDLCGHVTVKNGEGYLVCINPSCATLYTDVLDQTAEWRFYGAGDENGHGDPSRCGMPFNETFSESSFGCHVSVPKGCANNDMRMAQRYSEWQAMPYRERIMYNEFQQIAQMANVAGIPKKIIDDATRFHKQISDNSQSFRGSNRESILAASIYIACRINGFPRTAREISAIFRLDPSSATKGCKNAVTILNEIERDKEAHEKTNLGRTTPDVFIDRFCSALEMSDELVRVCKFVIMQIGKRGLLDDNTPLSIAAGVIFFVCNACNVPGVTKRRVSDVTQTSEVTINKCFRLLQANIAQLLPGKIVAKYNVVLPNASASVAAA